MPFSKDIRKLSISIIFFLFAFSGFAQISHGGEPLPLNVESRARVAVPIADYFVEMPAFNIQEAVLRSQQERAKFKSLEFAHKFHVFLRPDNSGINFTWGDINVWRVGIRSKEALSLNILFSKFRLPKGAKVFVYNADQSEVLGSYTQENNTELNLLPVQPIVGDELIVEYQEPINAEFKGEIEVGEVNHDFLGILRAAEPRDPEQSCHPNIVCYPEDIIPGSGVVALMINGTTYCTASLINNSSNDGTPYLITATHCLNDDYSSTFLANRKYDLIAGTIVAFFGYQSPVCDKNIMIRGPIQMTLASADSVLIQEDYDISLLRFKTSPPVYYQPYHLGWNVSSAPSAPFHGIHHPNGGVKKVAIENDNIQLADVTNDYSFVEKSPTHWVVRAWDVGVTEGGSSGSPLLDNAKRVVGTLTGGASFCSSPKGPDHYASLHKAWNEAIPDGHGNIISLKNFLDPSDSQVQQIDGYNPYASQPFTKNSNFAFTDSITQTYHNSVPMFMTNNTFGYSEFAEEFLAPNGAKLQGVFLSFAPVQLSNTSSRVRIRVYSGETKPDGTPLHEHTFNYVFRHRYDRAANRWVRASINHEDYIEFDSPINVSGKFYISYSDAANVSNGFSTLNVTPRKIGSGKISTAWMKNAQGWMRSSENIENPINTTLLISPYVIGTGLTPPTPKPDAVEIKAYYIKEVDRIFIESNKDLISWEIFYVSGQKIFEGKAESSINRTSFSVGHFVKGVYVVKVNVDGKSENLKVLVR